MTFFPLTSSAFKQFRSAAFVTSSFSSANASGYIFSSVSAGAAPTGDSRRFIFVTVESVSGNNLRDFTSGKINDVTATTINTRSDDGSGSTAVVAAFYAEVSSGTTVKIDVNFDGTMAGCNVGTFRVEAGPDGIETPTSDLESIGDVSTFNINIVAGSYVFANGAAVSGGAGTWTELTEHYDTDLSVNDFGSAASKEFLAPQTPLTFTRTVTGTVEHAGMAVEVRPA